MKESFSNFDIKNEEEFYRIVNKVVPKFLEDYSVYNLDIGSMFSIAYYWLETMGGVLGHCNIYVYFFWKRIYWL